MERNLSICKRRLENKLRFRQKVHVYKIILVLELIKRLSQLNKKIFDVLVFVLIIKKVIIRASQFFQHLVLQFSTEEYCLVLITESQFILNNPLLNCLKIRQKFSLKAIEQLVKVFQKSLGLNLIFFGYFFVKSSKNIDLCYFVCLVIIFF